MELQSEDIDRIAKAVTSMMEPALHPDIALWSVRDVASFLRRSPAQVRGRIVCLPKFPKAIRIPVDGSDGKAQPLWKAKEVINWAYSFQN